MFEGGLVNLYEVENERVESERQRVESIIHSDRNGKGRVYLGDKVVLTNTKLLNYEIR